MDAIMEPSKLRPEQFLASVIAICIVSTAIIALRIWSNMRHSGRVFIDDYLAVVGVVFLILNSASFYLLLSTLNAKPNPSTIHNITTQCSVGIFAGNMAMYTAKLPLLFLFIRTFGIKVWLRWTCRILVMFGALGFLASATYATTQCSPALHPGGGQPFLLTCIQGVTHGTIARGSLSLFIDIILFFLPFPVLKSLNMPFRRKLGLAFVFMAGLLAIGASALGVYYQTTQDGGTTDNFANALLITVVESCIVLLCSCAPALHLFWTKHAVALRARLGLTRVSVTSTSKSVVPEDSTRATRHKDEMGRPYSVPTSSRPRQSVSHQYIELRDSPHAESRELPPGSLASNKRSYVV